VKQVFITGGTGYIGRRLVALLLVNMMKDFQQCRARRRSCYQRYDNTRDIYKTVVCSGPGTLLATIVQPIFAIPETLPATSQKAKALRLVTLKQMLHALLYAIENMPEKGVKIIEIDDIKNM